MSAEHFLDTNVLVYSFDDSEPHKRDRARELISDALSAGTGVISYQVVQEFLNVATRKFQSPLSFSEASTYLDRVLAPLCRVFPTIELYHRGLQIQGRWTYSFYDALIVAAALGAGCAVLYTEDLQHGQVVEGLRIENPFLT